MEQQEKREKGYLKYRQLADEKGGMSDYMIAKKAGFSQVTLTDWRKGKSMPKVDKLQKVAAVLGVKLEELLA